MPVPCLSWSQAQVIYSTTPLWAAGFAVLALDASDEAMGMIAWAGAAVMLGSSLMTALIPATATAPVLTTGTTSSQDEVRGALGSVMDYQL